MPATCSFAVFEQGDIPSLTTIMTAAFNQDAQLFHGKQEDGPPGYDTGEFFRKWLFGQEVTAGFKILSDGEIVGATIVWIHPSGENFLGTIFVDPEHQNKGIGSQTWRFIEASYPLARSWSLTTPALSKRNRHFYVAKCGFREERIEDGFVHMKKITKADIAPEPGNGVRP